MRKLYLLMSLICVSQTGWACSCIGIPTFCETISGTYPPDLIVQARKIEDVYYGMRISVIQVLMGEEGRKELTVWGDNGGLCRLYTGGFGIGDTLILALSQTDQMGNRITVPEFPPDLEQEDDYHLSGCGVFQLDVRQGMVVGAISAGISSLPYADFIKRLRDQTCKLSVYQPEFNVVPSPTQGTLYIALDPFFRQNANLRITDMQGRRVLDIQEIEEYLEIDVRSWASGIYYVELDYGPIDFRKKVWVNN